MSGQDPQSIGTLKEAAAQDLHYHTRQFEEPYRSTVHLARFIESVVPQSGGEALDVGCGAGANIVHLSRRLPGYRWSGLDIVGDVLFEHGRAEMRKRGVDANLVDGDFYKLTEIFGERTFDLVLSVQTLMTKPRYEEALDQLLQVSRGWVIVTSLFTEFDVDAEVAMKDHTWPEHCAATFYSIYSLPRFRRYCEERGARRIVTRTFEIDVDLPAPSTGGLGTYTRRLQDGSRLQFSGPLHMPWTFVAVQMS